MNSQSAPPPSDESPSSRESVSKDTLFQVHAGESALGGLYKLIATASLVFIGGGILSADRLASTSVCALVFLSLSWIFFIVAIGFVCASYFLNAKTTHEALWIDFDADKIQQLGKWSDRTSLAGTVFFLLALCITVILAVVNIALT